MLDRVFRALLCRCLGGLLRGRMLGRRGALFSHRCFEGGILGMSGFILALDSMLMFATVLMMKSTKNMSYGSCQIIRDLTIANMKIICKHINIGQITREAYLSTS